MHSLVMTGPIPEKEVMNNKVYYFDLFKVLSSLKNRSMLSSVTRRSAGLPIIIQAVLVSEKKVKKVQVI